MATKLINGVYHVGETVGGGGDLPENIVTYVPVGNENFPDGFTPPTQGGSMVIELTADVSASMSLESISNISKTPKEVYEHMVSGGSVMAIVHMTRLGTDVQTMYVQNCASTYLGAMDMYVVIIDPGVGEKITGIQQGADAEPSWDIQ